MTYAGETVSPYSVPTGRGRVTAFSNRHASGTFAPPSTGTRERVAGLAEATRRGSTVDGGRSGQPAVPAKYMKVQGTIPSGTLNNAVSYMTRYGVVVRSRSWHSSVYSEAQGRTKDSFRYYSQLWRTLSDPERAAWNKGATKTRSRPRAATPGR
jgi:hypothetical protein